MIQQSMHKTYMKIVLELPAVKNEAPIHSQNAVNTLMNKLGGTHDVVIGKPQDPKISSKIQNELLPVSKFVFKHCL